MPRDIVWWALRKLGIEEWFVKVTQSMYSNARSRVRDGWTFSVDGLLVQVELHQSSVSSSLLFII